MCKILKFYADIQFPLKLMGLKYQVIQFVMKYILQTTWQPSIWEYTYNLAVRSSPITIGVLNSSL